MFVICPFCFRLCGYLSIVFELYLTDPIFLDFLTDPLFILFRRIDHACRHLFHDFGRCWPAYKIRRRKRKLSVCATAYTYLYPVCTEYWYDFELYLQLTFGRPFFVTTECVRIFLKKYIYNTATDIFFYAHCIVFNTRYFWNKKFDVDV